jgi:putative nucleotidyltransferase with HDIG domain
MLRERFVWWALLYTVIITLLGGLLIHAADRRPEYVVGQLTTHPIVPRTEFLAIDERETEIRKQNARDREPSVYKRNDAYFMQIKVAMEQLLQIGQDYEKPEQIPTDLRQSLAIDDRALSELKQASADDTQRADWSQKIDRLLERIAGLAMLTPDRMEAETRGGTLSSTIFIQHPLYGELSRTNSNGYSLSDGDDRFYSTEMSSRFRTDVRKLVQTQFPAALRQAVITVITDRINPTYVFDQDKTKARKQAAYERVEPATLTYATDSVMIKAGTTLKSQDIHLLELENKAYRDNLKKQKLVGMLSISLAMLIGRFGLLLVVSLAMWVYIIGFSRRIAVNPMRGLALTVLVLGCQALAIAGAINFPQYLFATTVYPTLIVAMILAISYDQRFALAMGASHTLIVMLSLNLSTEFAIVTLSGVGIIASLLDDVRTRSRVVIVGFWAGCAMALACLFGNLASTDMALWGSLDLIWSDSAWLVLVGLLTGVFVQGILPVVERLFRVTTSMTLRELNDASHPLLIRMAEEAPGTFQHSLRIADMAESAAEAIGANGLLCRVGAMFHDIGKMNKPSYFVENQGGGPNKHTKLSPAMSLLIIVGHVKDGIEMAREFGLPVTVRGFIETHHGTTLVEYFYHAAKQINAAENNPAPADFEFRYPGPKPQSREQAILMLSDALEGASRTLAEPTPVRLEQLVHTMAMKRLMDGQFDQSNMTLKELHAIETAITRTLCAIYHGRIKYPSDKPQADNKPAASTNVAAS